MVRENKGGVGMFLEVLRVRQWSKNLLVFAGLIFSAKFREVDALVTSVLTFLAFCIGSSAGYLINDVIDREADRHHPEKRLRAVASGRLSVRGALVSAVILLMGALFLSASAHLNALIGLGCYFVNQLFYTLIARRVALLDVFILSAGFLIRAVTGAGALSVTISPWLLLCTFLLALFLGFSKRKHELSLMEQKGALSRPSLYGYSPQLLDQLIILSATSAVIAYGVYAIESQTARSHPLLFLTIPFPLFGVARYLQCVYKNKGGGNPDKALLEDPWLWGTVIAWILVSLVVMSVDNTLGSQWR